MGRREAGQEKDGSTTGQLQQRLLALSNSGGPAEGSAEGNVTSVSVLLWTDKTLQQRSPSATSL